MREHDPSRLMGGFIEGWPEICVEQGELLGWHAEDFGDVLNRLFYKETGPWTEEIIEFTELILSAVSSTCEPLGYRELQEQKVVPFVLIKGSIARRWHHDSPYMFDVYSVFQRILKSGREKLGELDEVGQKALNGLIDGPYDVDIKISTDAETFSQKMVGEIKSSIVSFFNMFSVGKVEEREDEKVWQYYLVGPRLKPETAEVKMWQKDLGNGKSTLFLRLKEKRPPHRSFNIQITSNPEAWKELVEDFRAGKHFSRKQNISALLARDERNASDVKTLIVDRKDFYDYDEVLFSQPESIERPEYENLPQALMASLRMVRDVCLWPPENPNDLTDFIDMKTIRIFRGALELVFKKFLKSDEELELYRVEEIIREVILCLSLNPVIFTRLTSALGILDLFLPELGDILDKRWGWWWTDKGREVMREEMAGDIIGKFRFSSGSLFSFEKQYRERLRSLSLEEIGPLVFLKAVQELGCFSKRPVNLASAVEIFDLRKLKRRY